MDGLCDLLFEVSNEDRLSILRELRDREMNVTTIARTIDVTTQEVSRHLSRLTEVGLTEKDPNGPYIASAFPHIRDAFERGVRGSFLHGKSLEIPEEMMDERDGSFDDEFILKITRSGLYEERILDVPLIMYLSEKELALLSFPKRDGRFDFFG